MTHQRWRSVAGKAPHYEGFAGAVLLIDRLLSIVNRFPSDLLGGPLATWRSTHFS